jgi:hypothetical protein
MTGPFRGPSRSLRHRFSHRGPSDATAREARRRVGGDASRKASSGGGVAAASALEADPRRRGVLNRMCSWQRQQDSSDELAPLADRGDRDLDLAIPLNPVESVLDPRERHGLTSRRPRGRDDHAVGIHPEHAILPTGQRLQAPILEGEQPVSCARHAWTVSRPGGPLVADARSNPRAGASAAAKEPPTALLALGTAVACGRADQTGRSVPNPATSPCEVTGSSRRRHASGDLEELRGHRRRQAPGNATGRSPRRST